MKLTIYFFSLVIRRDSELKSRFPFSPKKANGSKTKKTANILIRIRSLTKN